MNKKIIIGILLVVVVGIGYYTLSPFWNNNELNEDSPLIQNQEEFTVIKDNLDTMDDVTMSEFKAKVEAMKDKTIVMTDAGPSRAKLLAQGNFKPRAHDVAGKALLIEKDGQKIVRFENFETINGPDVDIYLASELSDDDIVNLGDLKATKVFGANWNRHQQIQQSTRMV
jgi:uncharacterized protein YxeA